jgi:hypothetical protein
VDQHRGGIVEQINVVHDEQNRPTIRSRLNDGACLRYEGSQPCVAETEVGSKRAEWKLRCTAGRTYTYDMVSGCHGISSRRCHSTLARSSSPSQKTTTTQSSTKDIADRFELT